MKKILTDSTGIALVMVVLIMVILLSVTGAALLLSGLNLKTASNLKTGGGAIHAADAGIQHALAVITNAPDFTYGSGATAVSTTVFPNASSGYSYVVTATNNPPASANTSTAILTSTATGPNNSRRIIRAYIGRSSTTWTPPGAVYIPGASTSSEVFDPNGTAYTLTGNDTNYDNTAGSQPAVSGIASTNANIVSGILSTLNTDAKRQRVTGAGYAAGPPVTPSVQSTSRIDDVNAMAQSFINQVTVPACPPKCTSGYNTSLDVTSCPAANPCALGTELLPQITYITGQPTTNLGGYVNGYGVLVVKDTELNLLDNFNFHGLVIYLKSATGTPNIELQVKGNAQIYGGLLLGPNNNELEFEIKDTAAIRYSSQAISMVNTNWFSCCLAKPVKLIAWSELMQ